MLHAYIFAKMTNQISEDPTYQKKKISEDPRDLALPKVSFSSILRAYYSTNPYPQSFRDVIRRVLV